MIVLAIVATLFALGASFMVLWANAMRSSPGEFQGLAGIVSAWVASIVVWLAWWVG